MSEHKLSLSQIINEYAEENGMAVNPKKLTPAFTDYITELGIDPRNLKNSKGQYSFSGDDVGFIKKFFQGYTSRENREVRAKKGVVSANEITRWLALIQNTMSVNGKSKEEVQIQCNKFYRTSKPDRRKIVNSIAAEIARMLIDFSKEVDNEQFALPTDKELVLEQMRLRTLQAVKDNIKMLEDLLFYFHEVRTEDISDYGIASANDSELALYNEGTFALNRLCRRDKYYRKKLANLAKLNEQYHATDQSFRVRLITEIEDRKKELCQQVAEELNLNSSKLWEHSQADELKTSEEIWLQFFNDC